MERFKIIGAILVFSLSSCSHQIINDLMVSQLKGKVMKVTETSYYAHENNHEIVIDSLVDKNIVEYNSFGFKCRKEYYSHDSSLLYTAIGCYDKNGRRVRVEKYNATGELTDIATPKYNTEGLELEFSVYNIASDSIVEFQKYRYDDRNLCVEEKYFDENGDLHFKVKYEYDSTNISREDFYGKNESVLINFRFSGYDDAGNWKVRLEYEKNFLVRVKERDIIYYK